MLISLKLPEDGTVSRVKPTGAILEPGDLIATLELDDPSQITLAEVYEGSIPLALHTPKPIADKPLAKLRAASDTIGLLMAVSIPCFWFVRRGRGRV